MGKPFAEVGHGDTDRQAEQGPEAVDSIAKEMNLVPFNEKIAGHHQNQQGEKEPLQRFAMSVQVFKEFGHVASICVCAMPSYIR
jgi:hypothetical protein